MYAIFLSLLSLSLQKYLHESRHKHAIKRSRGYSGRFCGKDSPQKSPDTSISGSLPPTQTTPTKTPPTTTISSSSNGGGQSELSVAGSTQYQSVMECLKETVLRAVNVAPEMSPAGEEDVPVVDPRLVSLHLNQLGVNPLTQPASSAGLGLPSGEQGETTIQGLVHAAQTFPVPMLCMEQQELAPPATQSAVASGAGLSLSSPHVITCQMTSVVGTANFPPPSPGSLATSEPPPLSGVDASTTNIGPPSLLDEGKTLPITPTSSI